MLSIWVIFRSPFFFFLFFSQKMLTEVWTKFRLFQKPANFDTRLTECERALNAVKAQAAMLEIGSVEHDVVQSQLEQCMVSSGVPVMARRFQPAASLVSHRSCTRC